MFRWSCRWCSVGAPSGTSSNGGDEDEGLAVGGSHVEPIAAEGKGTGSHFCHQNSKPGRWVRFRALFSSLSYGAGVRRAGSDSRLTLLCDIKEV